MSTSRGITLIEMLLSVALIALIAAMGTPIYQSLQTKNDLDIAVESFVESTRRAQALSRASQYDDMWGVYATSGAITLFRGATFVSRNADYDEVFDMPTVITVSGLGEISFAKFTGVPSSTGTTTFTLNAGSARSIFINSKGMLAY